jgi:IPT/TIG domain
VRPRRRAHVLVAAVVALAVAALPASAGAVSVLLGPPDLSAFTNSTVPDGCNVAAGDSCENLLGNLVPSSPMTVLKAPADGTMTSWSIRGQSSGAVQVFLRVVHPAGGNDVVSGGITAGGAASLPVVNQPTSVPVTAGDFLMADMTCSPPCEARVYRRTSPVASYGFTSSLSASVPTSLSVVSGLELGYNATVELAAPVISKLTPPFGSNAGGDAIIIDGQHLAVATSVTFDGVPGSIVSGTSTKIAVRAPAHATGPAKVAVTTAGGTGTADFAYVRTTDPEPTTTTTVDQSAPPPPPDQVPPTISNPKLSAPSLVAGSSAVTVTYRLSEPAMSILTVQRRVTGVRKGRSCVTRTRRVHGRACTRWVAVKGSITHVDAAGIVKLRFDGRIGGHKLSPGHYRLAITAVDAAGNRSKVGTVQFTVKLPKRTRH